MLEILKGLWAARRAVAGDWPVRQNIRRQNHPGWGLQENLKARAIFFCVSLALILAGPAKARIETDTAALILGGLLVSDQETADFVRRNNDSESVSSFMRNASKLMSPGKLLTGSLAASQLATSERDRRTFKLAATAAIETGLITSALKEITDRRRPFEKAALAADPSFPSEFDSFPSGHASAAFAVMTVLAHEQPENRKTYMALGCLVAVSRVYLEKHYPSDVFAGALVGYFVAEHVVKNGKGLLGWRF